MASFDLKAIITAEDKTQGTFKKFGDTVDDNAKKTSKFSGAMTGLKVAAAGAAIYGLKVAAEMAVDFDKSMRNVNSIAKLSSKEFADMSNQILDLSKKLPQTAQQLSDAMYEVYSSGFNGAEAMAVLEQSAIGASAGLTDTQTAGKALMGIMNAYNMKTGPDAAKIMDVLFKTVDVGVLSFEELAQNIGDVVATASAAKVPIEQIGAALATMTKKGINAAEATTALNMMILKFIQPTDSMSEALTKLGYESGLAAIQSDGLNTVLQKLWVQSGQNVDAFIPLFGEVRAGKAALSLASDGGQQFTADLNAMAAASGSAKAALNEQNKSVSAQYTLLKNQLNAEWMKLAVVVMPTVAKSVGYFTTGLNVIAGAIKNVYNWLNNAVAAITKFQTKFVEFIVKYNPGNILATMLKKRAVGGPVTSGQPYIVGEKGPEMFVPSQSGSIVPNNKLGQGNQISVNFYGNMNNTESMSVDQIGQVIGRQVELALMGVR